MKKILSLLLAVILLLSPAAIVASAENNNETIPFVLVRGMEFNGLISNYGTPDATPAIKSIDSEKIGDALKNCIKGFFFGGKDGFVMALCDFVFYILGDMGMNPDGTSTNNVYLDTYPLAVSNYPGFISSLGNGNEDGIIKGAIDKYGADNCYYFRYDWRIDPFYNAQGVEKIIEQAKSDHGCDKVNLVCCSMGGVVTIAYMSEYGSDDLNKVIFLSSAFCGTYVASDVLQGKVHIGSDELYNFATNTFTDYTDTFNFLQKTHMLKIATCLLNKFIENNKSLVFSYLLRDIFGTMPAFWAIVLPEDYDACIDYIFPTEELKLKYKTIIDLSEKYQDMRANRDDILAQAQSNGTTFGVIATYNVPLIPVYERACTNGDGTLETALMLGEATVANYGETLYETYGDSYSPVIDGYISPDDVIDMSTALFPDYTWCFKNTPHISCNYRSDMQNFLFWLVDYNGQATINSNPSYPQYMLISPDNSIEYFE